MDIPFSILFRLVMEALERLIIILAVLVSSFLILILEIDYGFYFNIFNNTLICKFICSLIRCSILVVGNSLFPVNDRIGSIPCTPISIQSYIFLNNRIKFKFLRFFSFFKCHQFTCCLIKSRCSSPVTEPVSFPLGISRLSIGSRRTIVYPCR